MALVCRLVAEIDCRLVSIFKFWIDFKQLSAIRALLKVMFFLSPAGYFYLINEIHESMQTKI